MKLAIAVELLLKVVFVVLWCHVQY